MYLLALCFVAPEKINLSTVPDPGVRDHGPPGAHRVRPSGTMGAPGAHPVRTRGSMVPDPRVRDREKIDLFRSYEAKCKQIHKNDWTSIHAYESVCNLLRRS